MRITQRYFCALFFADLIFYVNTPLFSHDLTLMGGVDNYQYEKTTYLTTPKINDQNLGIVANIKLSGDFAENISYSLEGGMDNLWRYYFAGDAIFHFSPLVFGAGAFFQYAENGREFLYPAFTAHLGFEIPGGFFLNAKTSITPYKNLNRYGNIGYTHISASLGYWGEHVMFGLFYEDKSYEERRAVVPVILLEALTKYYFHIGVFDKNRAFTVYLDGGYQILGSQTYNDDKTRTYGDMADTVFFGTEIIIKFSNFFSWHVKAEIPFAIFYPYSDYFWYKGWTGITLHLAD